MADSTKSINPLENKKLGEILEILRYDALAFVRYVIRPDIISSDQEKFLNAISKDNARVSVVSGTTTGKTATLAWTVLWFLSTRQNVKMPITSTTEKQTLNVLWPELSIWHKRMIPEFRDRILLTKERACLVGDEMNTYAYPLVSKPESVEGFQGIHAKNIAIIVDEASGICQQIFDAMRGSISTPGAKWIVAGNGVRSHGPFFDSHNKSKELWTCLNFSSLNSPFCSKDYCDSVAREYGIESNMYRTRVLGKFPTADEDVCIPFDWCEAAINREIVPLEDDPVVAGLDPSGGGKDAVGFILRKGNRFYGAKRWKGIDGMECVGKVAQLWKERKFDKIMVDAIGVGSGVAARLMELGIPTAAINVTMPSIMMRETCRCLKDELWWKMRNLMESGLCSISTEGSDPNTIDVLVHELSTPKYSVNSAGKIVIEDKNSLRKANRLGHSPDMADCAVLTLAEGVLVENSRDADDSKTVVPSGENYIW